MRLLVSILAASWLVTAAQLWSAPKTPRRGALKQATRGEIVERQASRSQAKRATLSPAPIIPTNTNPQTFVIYFASSDGTGASTYGTDYSSSTLEINYGGNLADADLYYLDGDSYLRRATNQNGAPLDTYAAAEAGTTSNSISGDILFFPSSTIDQNSFLYYVSCSEDALTFQLSCALVNPPTGNLFTALAVDSSNHALVFANPSYVGQGTLHGVRIYAYSAIP